MPSSPFITTKFIDEPPQAEDRTIFHDIKRYSRITLPQNPYTDTYQAIILKYNIKTAVDFGCGLGVDTHTLLTLGVNIIGVDGVSINIVGPHLLFPSSRYFQVDLRNNLKLPLGVDLIHCREVAEHIPFKYSQMLVRNIVRNCHATYFTAAPPGQIGSGHINCQYRAFWLSLFYKYEWSLDSDLTKFNEDNHTNHLDRKNGMVLFGPRRHMLRM